MSRPISLQKRLVYGLTLGMMVLWLLAALTSGLVVHKELNKTFDSAMQQTAERLLPLAILDILNREEDVLSQRVASLKSQQESYNYLVRDHKGNVLLQSSGADLSVFETEPLQGFDSSGTHRLFGASALRDTVFLQIAEPLSHRRQATLKAVTALLVPLFFLVPLSLISVWVFVQFSLKSIQSYRYAVESRGVGNLSPLYVDDLPVEISPIAVAINRLIERLRHALASERRFAENSAHELRTPLASALAQVQRLRRELTEQSHHDKAAEIETSLKGLSRLSEKLLQLAKAEGGGLLSEVPQDLNILLTHVTEELQRTASVPIKLSVPSISVMSLVDPDIFAILVKNLIENALKHGWDIEPVQVTLTDEGKLIVINSGPLVSAQDLERLTHRFVRVREHTEGSGLGLAIAATIAQGIGSELKFRSPATGRKNGFEVSMQLERV